MSSRMTTFPASDPPAVEGAFETAYEREQRGTGGAQAHQDGAATPAPPTLKHGAWHSAR